jgi:hypothetical protein
MSQTYIALVAGGFGLVGALIGAASSVLTVWIQAKTQDRRAALAQAAELALADYKLRMENAPAGAAFGPASIFIAYQVEVMKLIENGEFTPEAFRALSDKFDALDNAAKEMAEERREARQRGRAADQG